MYGQKKQQSTKEPKSTLNLYYPIPQIPQQQQRLNQNFFVPKKVFPKETNSVPESEFNYARMSSKNPNNVEHKVKKPWKEAKKPYVQTLVPDATFKYNYQNDPVEMFGRVLRGIFPVTDNNEIDTDKIKHIMNPKKSQL
jgi:hypothetical protein